MLVSVFHSACSLIGVNTTPHCHPLRALPPSFLRYPHCTLLRVVLQCSVCVSLSMAHHQCCCPAHLSLSTSLQCSSSAHIPSLFSPHSFSSPHSLSLFYLLTLSVRSSSVSRRLSMCLSLLVAASSHTLTLMARRCLLSMWLGSTSSQALTRCPLVSAACGLLHFVWFAFSCLPNVI